MTHFSPNQLPLACRTWGDPQLPPLLLLHGFMGSSADWDATATALASDYRCIAPELPGHGATPFDPAIHGTFAGYTGSVLACIERLELNGVAALGYSMGGRLLLSLAAAIPTLFSRLILESVSPGLEDAEAQRRRLLEDDALALRLQHEAPRDFFAWWYSLPLFGDIKSCEGYRAMLERRLSGHAQDHARALRAASVGHQPALWDALGALEIPMRVVYGEDDTRYTLLSTRMAAASPRISVTSVPAAGHAVHVEQPERFVAICRSFLKE